MKKTMIERFIATANIYKRFRLFDDEHLAYIAGMINMMECAKIKIYGFDTADNTDSFLIDGKFYVWNECQYVLK